MPLEKYKKECDVVKVTLVQGFCSLKITITQFWNPLGCADENTEKKFSLGFSQ